MSNKELLKEIFREIVLHPEKLEWERKLNIQEEIREVWSGSKCFGESGKDYSWLRISLVRKPHGIFSKKRYEVTMGLNDYDKANEKKSSVSLNFDSSKEECDNVEILI